MNTIIELNQQAIDLRDLKSIELCGAPISGEGEHELKLRFLRGKEILFNELVKDYQIVEPELHIPYPDYFKAARAHSVLKRAWSRYRDDEERKALLRTVEKELNMA
jgi:hypothetical protein